MAGMKRIITKIWRGSGESQNEALVEWQHVFDRSLEDRKIHDRTLPPTQEFHDAFDELKSFIAGPYSIHQSVVRKVRPRAVTLERKGERLLVALHGQMESEGFNSPVHLHVPKQDAEGNLSKAIADLVKQAEAFIDGERGTRDLLEDTDET